jgi:hypothetical protein
MTNNLRCFLQKEVKQESKRVHKKAKMKDKEGGVGIIS